MTSGEAYDVMTKELQAKARRLARLTTDEACDVVIVPVLQDLLNMAVTNFQEQSAKREQAEKERDNAIEGGLKFEAERDSLKAELGRVREELAMEQAHMACEIAVKSDKADRDSLRSQLGVAQGQVGALRKELIRAGSTAEWDIDRRVCRYCGGPIDGNGDRDCPTHAALRDTSPKTPAEAQPKTEGKP